MFFIESVSDQEGRFEFVICQKGPAKLSIVPREQCMKHIDLGAKRGDLGDIVLSPGTSIRGRVLDAAGKPMAGLWVNLTEVDTVRSASYEMKRSSKSDERGEFRTRPIRPGKYSVSVETKATGALEKQKYANFHKEPTAAMFVKQFIDVTEDSFDKPFVIQAVPHVYISGQCYDSKGELRDCHSPYLMGRFNDQSVRIRKGRSHQKGAFELMVPHGVEKASLNIMTNEHSAYSVQFGDNPPSPQTQYDYKTIEEDITDIKLIRYVAPILQVKVVDEQGDDVQDARVMAMYTEQREADNMMYERPFTSYFEKQENAVHRSSSLCPGFEFEVYAVKDGFESERTTMTMEEDTNDQITLTLKPKIDEEVPSE